MSRTIQKEELNFGEPGTEDWFGGIKTAEWLQRNLQAEIAQLERNRILFGHHFGSTWFSRNARAALRRREPLPPEHPFRADDAELALIAEGSLDIARVDLDST